MMASWPEPVDPDNASPRPGRDWTLLVIGLGGAVGTGVRYIIEAAFPAAPGGWPWATFLINITGAFILAALLETLSRSGPDDGWRRRVRLGVGTGVLGGYTTYSSFMVEATLLGDTGHYLVAVGYVAASVLLGLAAAWVGLASVAGLHRRRAGVQT